MHTAQHKVEEAFEILSAALHVGKSHHSRFLNRAHALLESALSDMERESHAEEEYVYIGEFPPLPKGD